MEGNTEKMDLGNNFDEASELFQMSLKQKAVLIFTSLFSEPWLKLFCKMKAVMQNSYYVKIYGWISKDSEGSQHTTGFIMRQGLKTPLIAKGKRRMKGLFEGGVFQKEVPEAVEKVDIGPMMQSNRGFYDILKCISKQVNSHQAEFESQCQ